MFTLRNAKHTLNFNSMPWNVCHNELLHIVELELAGNITGRDMRDATTQCIALGKENETNRFLVDTTHLELAASLMEIYNLPEKQYIEEGADRFSRVAVIRPLSPSAQEATQFYETVCRNRGWMVQLFPKHREAVDWLVNDSSLTKASVDEDLK